MLVTYRDGLELVTAECTVLRPVHVDGECDLCAAPLPPRRSRWCSRACQIAYEANHLWNMARAAARRRDRYRCRRCGSPGPLEVNHLVPRLGRGYGWGCHNHLDVLETVCHDCHVLITRQQALERDRAATPARRGRRRRP